ncbi:MAP kinase kinase (MEK) [Orbilia brochopaga]|uniref:mitogen-activated protein kinase kinase n=1 Tax=Orbilia brochopaga TaxID=3140254 RepID=A0AAV9UAR3_9PEZI
MAADQFAPRTLAKKNKKGLTLGGRGGGGGESAPNIGSLTLSEPSISRSNGGIEIKTRKRDTLATQLSNLELGLEYRVELRAEDLEVLHELGSGNGGTVSKVVHKATKTTMARKVIHVEAKQAVRKQIVRELQIMYECHSPYIVSFYGAFLNGSDVIMCMEFMETGSLDHISNVMGSLEIGYLRVIAESVLRGLVYLYDVHKIMHRDIKPSNILVNGNGQIKLCDFGVSGELVNSIADTFVGTSTYMSPERIQGGKYTVKSDVWSFGLTMMELALGRFPFGSDGASGDKRASSGPMGILDLLQSIVNEPAPKLPEGKYPAELAEFCDKCLLKDPEQRPSPADLLKAPLIEMDLPVDLEKWADDIINTAAAKKAAKNGQPPPPPRIRDRTPPSIPTVGSQKKAKA